MNRSEFGSWGSELTDRDFAIAVGALGVAYYQLRRTKPSERAEKLNSILNRAFERRGFTLWRLRTHASRVFEYIAPVDASMLRDAWEEARKLVGPLRLEVQSNNHTRPILPWIVEQLMHPGLLLDGIYVRHEAEDTSAKWNWPVRIGLIPDLKSYSLMRELKEWRWRDRLAKIRILTTGESTCDLLVLLCSLREAVARLLSLPFRVRASCVVVTGDIDEPWNSAYSFIRTLQALVHASGVYVNIAPSEPHRGWINNLIEALSHNHFLDEAFLTVAKRAHKRGRVPLFFSSRRLIENSRLSNVFRQNVDRYQRVTKTSSLVLPPAQAGSWVEEKGLSRDPAELAIELRRRSTEHAYIRESGGGTDVAEIMQDLDEEMEKTSVPIVPRWIQTQVFEDQPGEGRQVRQTKAFRADTQHTLVVRVGPSDQEWMKPADARAPEVVFPEDKLPWEEEHERLHVVFSEPRHVPEPQVEAIVLPRKGASTTCRFSFRPKGNIASFHGRVILLHRNRVLQTALLSGQVVADPSQILDGELSLTIESAIQLNLRWLSARQDYDVAFVANHTTDHQPALTTIAGEQATFRSLENVKHCIKKIQSLLRGPLTATDAFPKDLGAEKNVAWLRLLALEGSSLYDGIVTDQIGKERLNNISRIQLVSAQEGFLPLEFLYDRPPPNLNAPLCPNAAQALENGSCEDCQYLLQHPSPFVCPLGFWCLRLVIERHRFDPQHPPGLQGYDYALRSEHLTGRGTLAVFKEAVFAASERVDKVVPGQREKVLKALKRATHGRARQVDNWRDWKNAVSTCPSLLVLLPHTSKHLPGNLSQMEIGKDAKLPERHISENHVRPSQTSPRPLVLLLGCETLAPDVPFQSFPAQFRRKGAAIVLSTLTKVLGRHAGPVAVQIVNSLEQAARQQMSFGDALLNVRRRVLAAGIPMVLCLVAYGDADWRLMA